MQRDQNCHLNRTFRLPPRTKMNQSLRLLRNERVVIQVDPTRPIQLEISVQSAQIHSDFRRCSQKSIKVHVRLPQQTRTYTSILYRQDTLPGFC